MSLTRAQLERIRGRLRVRVRRLRTRANHWADRIVSESMAAPEHGRPFGQVAFDACAITTFVALAWWWLAGVRLEGFGTIAIAIAATLGASLVTDFGTGFVHWAADTWGSERVPILGSTFIAPFREHHIDPKAITRHDFLETNGASASVVLPLLFAAGWLARVDGMLFWSVLFGMASVFTLATNQVHKWAHADVAPAPVRVLQRLGIVLSPEAHAVHHVAPHMRHYCITHGWLNPILDGIGFFRAAERIIVRVFGAAPRAEDLGNISAGHRASEPGTRRPGPRAANRSASP
jgi:hypothetical protein